MTIESPPSSETDTVASAFADFYRLHYPGAVRLAWLLTHDHSLTEDVVQDAFVRLQPKFDSVLDHPAYLRMCVVNGCRDRARGDVRSTTRLRMLSAVADTSSADHPSELFDAVSTLPYNQRAVVVLRYWADLPESEIAEIVGVRPGTVRTLVARGAAGRCRSQRMGQLRRRHLGCSRRAVRGLGRSPGTARTSRCDGHRT